MALNELGSTGLQVSRLGFGAFKIGRNQKTKYQTHYDLPSDQAVHQLLDGVLDCGINLFDTAPAYGESEARIGRYLRESGRRDEVVLCSKVGETFEDGSSSYAFDRSSVERSLDTSLERLGTGHIDLVSVHSDGKDLDIIRRSDVLEVLEERRARGEVRAIGFSGKTLEGHLACLEAEHPIDVLMVELNLLEQSQLPILAPAAEAGVGILIKKGLASGRLEASEALPWLLSHEAIGSVVVGGLSLDHVRANLVHVPG
ncbi:MAG: aldo/keto reductase [Phycisphaerales bacterium]|nr:aldo/keto reductase [Phycisphaerales bacterium]